LVEADACQRKLLRRIGAGVFRNLFQGFLRLDIILRRYWLNQKGKQKKIPKPVKTPCQFR